MKPAMKDVGDRLIKEYEGNFDRQSTTERKAWKPLKASTVAQRLSQGFGSSPILVRSGKLKKSFFKKVKRLSVLVSNKKDYFKYHQLGGKVKNRPPKREMLGLSKNLTEDIIEIINKFFRKNIKK